MSLEKDVLQACEKAGLEVYEVGGAVRDSLLGLPNDDIDLMVAATSLGEVPDVPNTSKLEVGAAYGVLVFVRGDEKIDVALPRRDVAYGETRTDCEVEFTDPVEDLSRRDFTVNALARNLKTGELLDPFDGQRDLDRKVIRAVGNPLERFREDPLRVLRAFRFAARLGFEIDPETLAACSAADLLRRLEEEISWERKREEVLKMVKTAKTRFDLTRVLRLMEETGVLRVVLPEVSRLRGLGFDSRYHDVDPFDHTLLAIEAYEGNDVVVRLALLFHDIGKAVCLKPDFSSPGHAKVGGEMVNQIAERLRFTNRLRDEVRNLVSGHMDRLDTGPMAKRLKRVTRGTTLERGFAVRRADVLGRGRPDVKEVSRLDALYEELKALEASKPALSVRDLAVNGHDLMACGFSEGPKLGVAIKKLLEEVLNGDLENERDLLLSRAQELL
jgi:tRNA nucleotidyltransferase (CCA-adding enzyme)